MTEEQIREVVRQEIKLALDGRTVAQAMARYVTQRAARGPASFVGGSLVTGAAPKDPE